MSHSGYSDEFTDDEEDEEEEEEAANTTKKADTTLDDAASDVSAASSLGKAVKRALHTGEYKSAKTADGREYWYHARTQETTWNLRRTLEQKRGSTASGTAPAAKAAAAAADTSTANTTGGGGGGLKAGGGGAPTLLTMTPLGSSGRPGSPSELAPHTSSLYRRRVERERSGSVGGFSVHTSHDGGSPAVSPIRDSPRRVDSVHLSRSSTPSALNPPGAPTAHRAASQQSLPGGGAASVSRASSAAGGVDAAGAGAAASSRPSSRMSSPAAVSKVASEDSVPSLGKPAPAAAATPAATADASPAAAAPPPASISVSPAPVAPPAAKRPPAPALAPPDTSDFSDVSTYLEKSKTSVAPAAGAALAEPSLASTATGLPPPNTTVVQSTPGAPGGVGVGASTLADMSGMAAAALAHGGAVGVSAMSLGASPGLTTIAKADTTLATASTAAGFSVSEMQHPHSAMMHAHPGHASINVTAGGSSVGAGGMPAATPGGAGAVRGAAHGGVVMGPHDTPIPFANISAETLAGGASGVGVLADGLHTTLGGPNAYSLPPHGPHGGAAGGAAPPATADMLCRLMAAYHEVLSNEDETAKFRKARREEKSRGGAAESVVQRIVPSGVTATPQETLEATLTGKGARKGAGGVRTREPPATFKTNAFKRESEAHGEVEEMILNLVMSMMLEKPGAAPSAHEALASRGFFTATGNNLSAASASAATHIKRKKQARGGGAAGFIDPVSFRNAALSSEQVRAWETPQHVTQHLHGGAGTAREPIRAGIKVTPFAGGWGGAQGPNGGHLFEEPNTLRDMCERNLEKFVVRRAMSDAVATPPEAARRLLVELLGIILQMVQAQGGKSHPVATYLLTYTGEARHHALVRTILHSLPWESLPYAAGGLKFRLEFWMQRSHIVEMAMALQTSLHRLEGVISATGGAGAAATPAAAGGDAVAHGPARDAQGNTNTFAAIAHDLQSMLNESRGGGGGADASFVMLQDAHPTFQLTILAHHDDAMMKEEDHATHGRGAGAAGPLDDLPLLNDQILTHLTTEIKLQGYARTGVHLNPSMVDAFLSHTLQEVLLDDVVKKTIVSQTLKKMGVKAKKVPGAQKQNTTAGEEETAEAR